MSQSNEAITIIMTGRDRFSQTEDCIETLIARTPQPYHLIVVLGARAQGVREPTPGAIWEDGDIGL